MAESHIPVKKIHLCCQICSQVLRNPATIPCGHNFCMQCIQGRLNSCPCSCPECGHVFPTRPQLIKNTTLADLVRDTERCDARSEKRKQLRSGKSVQALKRPCDSTNTGTSGSGLCLSHGRSLDVYCCTEEQIICAVCASAQHGGHVIGSVKGERQRKEAELKSIQKKSKQILQNLTKKWKTPEQIQEEARKTQDFCESVLAGVINSIQSHYLSVRRLIEAQETAVTAQAQTLQIKMEEMRKRSAELDRLAKTDSDFDFFERWSSLQRLCEEDHLHPDHTASEDPLHPFEFMKRVVEQLGRQLEALCDFEFASISQTGLPEVNNTVAIEQNVEPKTREDFLQYACSLSLDPATAHKDLVISEGDKEVRVIPPKYKRPARHYPERFVHRRQVLCREGLQAERCYYEIEVKVGKAEIGKAEIALAEIALAYKGIDRKSRTRVSAFGANALSWSLDCSTHYSVSHRADSIQLTSSPSHHRIGVYLKFKAGTLSFYEVSDSMKFLYEVKAEFTEPLYPGFWLEDKCYIRICDLSRNGL